MGFSPPRSTIVFFLAVSPAATTLSHVAENGDKETVRVTMTVNADGSRTSHEFDAANKKATALTTEKTVRCTRK
jgi:hypothetical protein